MPFCQTKTKLSVGCEMWNNTARKASNKGNDFQLTNPARLKNKNTGKRSTARSRQSSVQVSAQSIMRHNEASERPSEPLIPLVHVQVKPITIVPKPRVCDDSSLGLGSAQRYIDSDFSRTTRDTKNDLEPIKFDFHPQPTNEDTYFKENNHAGASSKKDESISNHQRTGRHRMRFFKKSTSGIPSLSDRSDTSHMTVPVPPKRRMTNMSAFGNGTKGSFPIMKMPTIIRRRNAEKQSNFREAVDIDDIETIEKDEYGMDVNSESDVQGMRLDQTFDEMNTSGNMRIELLASIRESQKGINFQKVARSLDLNAALLSRTDMEDDYEGVRGLSGRTPVELEALTAALQKHRDSAYVQVDNLSDKEL